MAYRTLLTALALLASGCSSRVEVSGASSSPPPAEEDPCGAALLPGAAAPILGYCPSRANQSHHRAPSIAPGVQVSIPTGEVNPEQAAVDEEGRIYLTLDTISEDQQSLRQTVLALLPDGAEAWRYEVQGNAWVGGIPVLTGDGGVLVLEATWNGSGYSKALLTFSREGAIEDEAIVPDDVRANPAVDSRGNLYFSTYDPDIPPRVVAVSKEGDVLWATEGLGDGTGAYQVPAVSPNGMIILGGRMSGGPSNVYALSPDTGDILWQQALDGDIVGGPAVSKNGSVYVSLGVEDLTAQELWVFSPEGAPTHKVSLGGEATPVAQALAVSEDGAAFVRLREEVVAVDRTGKQRFRRWVHPNLVYGATLDEAGMLLLTSGSLALLDPVTGEQQWELTPPDAFSCLGPATAAGPGRLLFGQCDGSLHIAGEP